MVLTATPDLIWRGVKCSTRHPARTAAFRFSASRSKPLPRTPRGKNLANSQLEKFQSAGYKTCNQPF